jgi:hypothetical protein
MANQQMKTPPQTVQINKAFQLAFWMGAPFHKGPPDRAVFADSVEDQFWQSGYLP